MSLYGLFLILDDAQPKLRAPLQKIQVKATTCGSIAHNSLQFHYKNTNKTAIESKFVFPANSESSIYHLEALVGNRKIVGQVKEKSQAEKEYREAVDAGKTAVMAKESKEASDIIELDIGAFPAGESAVVTIKEVSEMPLVKKGASFLYKFPTSLFVRYGDTITAEVRRTIPDYTLSFELTDHSGVAKITPKPWLKKEAGVESIEGGSFKFQNARKVFQKDHDVILDLQLAENFKGFKMTENLRDLKVIDKTDQKTDKHLTLSSVMVKIPTVPIAELPAKEFVFVVDCSGSMHGNRIADARKTLQQLINSLPVGSCFNIVRFGSSYEFLFKKSKAYTKENKSVALQLAQTMDADLGGTEMFSCLSKVLKADREIKNFKRQVFVLTDGGISNQDATLKLVTESSANNRIFSFGIGSGASSSLVNGLATAGKGVASFIADKGHGVNWEKSENLSEICIKSVMASASVNVSLMTVSPEDGLRAPNLESKMLVDSTCLNLFHDGDLKVPVELSMTVSDKDELQSVEVSKCDGPVLENPFEANVLHKLVAKKLITEMVVKMRDQDPWGRRSDRDYRKEITELSVKENVLSPYTALIGVADDQSVTGVSQRCDVPNYAEPEMYKAQRSFLCSAAPMMMRGGGMPPTNSIAMSLNCSAPPRAMMMKSCKSAGPVKRSKKKSAGLFNGFGFSKKSTKGQASPQAYCAPAASFAAPPPPQLQKQSMAMPVHRKVLEARCASSETSDSDMGGMLDFSVEEECEMVQSKAFTPPTSFKTYQDISNAQEPSGEWSMLITCGSSEKISKHLETIANDFNEKQKFTVIALLVLLDSFALEVNEWILSAVKGVAFLKIDEEKFMDCIPEDMEVDDELVSRLFN